MVKQDRYMTHLLRDANSVLRHVRFMIHRYVAASTCAETRCSMPNSRPTIGHSYTAEKEQEC